MYYASNAEPGIELHGDEANEVKEQEARRLRTKARGAMGDGHCGLSDVVEWAQ